MNRSKAHVGRAGHGMTYPGQGSWLGLLAINLFVIYNVIRCATLFGQHAKAAVQSMLHAQSQLLYSLPQHMFSACCMLEAHSCGGCALICSCEEPSVLQSSPANLQSLPGGRPPS